MLQTSSISNSTFQRRQLARLGIDHGAQPPTVCALHLPHHPPTAVDVERGERPAAINASNEFRVQYVSSRGQRPAPPPARCSGCGAWGTPCSGENPIHLMKKELPDTCINEAHRWCMKEL